MRRVAGLWKIIGTVIITLGTASLAQAAVVTGTISGSVLTIEGDANDNVITVTWLASTPQGGEGYAVATVAPDTVDITDSDGNANILGNLTANAIISIADSDLDEIIINAGVGADEINTNVLIDPLSANGNSGADTFKINSSITANLSGGFGIDTFDLGPGVTLTGFIDGETGADELVIRGADVEIALVDSFTDGFNGTTDRISVGFGLIKLLSAPGNDSVLTGINEPVSWQFAGTPSYFNGSHTLEFAGFETVRGGSSEDNFQLNQNRTVNIEGGGGADTLSVSSGVVQTGSFNGQTGIDLLVLASNNEDVALSGSDADGYDGTANSVSAGFDGVDHIQASGVGSDLFGTGPISGDAIWTLDGSPTFYNGAQTLEFSGFSQIFGAAVVNVFNVSANTTMIIKGSGSTDTLNLTNDAVLIGSFEGAGQPGDIDKITSTAANFQVVLSTSNGSTGYTGTATGISGGFQGVDRIEATGASSSLKGRDTDSAWSVGNQKTYDDGSGRVLEISGFETLSGGNLADEFVIHANVTVNLSGGGGDDTFNLHSNKTLTGVIDGNPGYDTLLLATDGGFADIGSFNLNGFDGNATGLSSLFLNMNAIHTSGTNSSLGVAITDAIVAGAQVPDDPQTIPPATCIWEIDSTPTYTTDEGTLDFSGFVDIEGCIVTNWVTVVPPLGIGPMTFGGPDDPSELVLDISNSALDVPFTFNGTKKGDTMALQFGGGPAPDTVEFELGVVFSADAINGIIHMTGNSPLTFTGVSSLPTFEQFNHAIVNLTALDGDVSVFYPNNSEMVLEVGVREYFRSATPTGTLTFIPWEGGASTWQFADLSLAFGSDLVFADNDGNTTLEWTGNSTLDTDTGILAVADRIDVQGSIELKGTGELTLQAQEDIQLSTASSALVTAGSNINLNADLSQTTGVFSSVAGATIDSTGGDIEVTGADMDILGTLSGGFVELLSSQPGGEFVLGGPLALAAGIDTPATALPPQIILDTVEIDNISAGDNLRIGDNTHASITILDTIDLTGQATSLQLYTRDGGSVQNMESLLPTIIVEDLSIMSTLRPGGSNGQAVFDVDGNLRFESPSSWEIELAGVGVGAPVDGYDRVVFHGSLDLSNSPSLDVLLVDGFVPEEDTQLGIGIADNSIAINGQFEALPEGSEISQGVSTLRLSYLGFNETSGNHVVLTVIGSEVIFADGFEEEIIPD